MAAPKIAATGYLLPRRGRWLKTDSIPLTLEVRNVGTEAVTIDKSVLWGGIELRDVGDPEVQLVAIT